MLVDDINSIVLQLLEEEDGEREMTELQKEIDAQLEKDSKKRTPKAQTNGQAKSHSASIPGPSLITIGNRNKASRPTCLIATSGVVNPCDHFEFNPPWDYPRTIVL